jgi:hypothetical protein
VEKEAHGSELHRQLLVQRQGDLGYDDTLHR